MSHHYSGPDLGFPRGDARLDLTDLFSFPKPGEAGRSILILNAHPSSSVNPPQPTIPEPFAPEAQYEIMIDRDGDAVADVAYRVRLSSSGGGAQTATLRRIEGPQAAGGYAPEDARRAAEKLLPDVLLYDPNRPARYPNNGRTLTDDVVDVFLPILTNGKVTEDKVGPHRDFLAEFPYLGPPHRP